MPGPSSLNPSLPRVSSAQGEAKREEIQQVARQLEGVFVGMMFEEMAKGLGQDENGLFPKTPGSDMYQQWFRGEVATQFSQGGGLGLGDVIAERLAERQGLPPEAAELRTGPRPPVEMLARARPSRAPPPPTRPGKVPPPVRGRLTSGFGVRTHPVTGRTDMHEGVDLAVPVGTAVRSPYGGRVVKVDEDAHLGVHVVVEHRGGYRSVYGHLSEASVRVGQRLDASAVLGRSGNSGRSTGPHLHFALYRHGEAVDPNRWVDLPGR